MLPASRCEGDLVCHLPKFSLDRGDVEDLTDELRGFHQQFQACFMRSEPRENFFLTWLVSSATWKGSLLNP